MRARILAVVSVVAIGCTPPMDPASDPLTDSEVALAAAKATAPGQVGKLQFCHVTGNGSYVPISVGGSAAFAHLAHGDVAQPNGEVPGSPGLVFDATCAPVAWSYAVNVAPDPTAFDPGSPGNLYVGSGIPAENFGTARNEAAGIELGMMLLYRQGPTITSADNYNDGVLNYNVAAGPQSTLNGSFANNTNRAAWNYTFSVATGLNGAPGDLTSHTFQLLIDVDPTAGVDYRTLTLEPGSPSIWRDGASNIVVINDDEGTANVTQNSQNYVFYGLPSYNILDAFAGPAQFDIILQALDGSQIIARNHIRVNVGA